MPSVINVDSSVPVQVVNRLHSLLAAACPIGNLTIGPFGQPGSIVFTPDITATPAQIAAAQSIITSFNWNPISYDAIAILTININALSITAIDAYLAIADTATILQVTAEVKAIDLRQKVIIQTLNTIINKLLG